MRKPGQALLAASILCVSMAAHPQAHAQRHGARSQQATRAAATKIETRGGRKTETLSASTRAEASAVSTRTRGVAHGSPSSSAAAAAVVTRSAAAFPTTSAATAGTTTASGLVSNATPTTTYYIGVVPGPSGCPGGSPQVTAFMDAEDNNNNNSSSGWIGGIVQTHNTELRFCRVSSQGFGNVPVPYAVLRMDTQCPAGSVPFDRTFDNEDDDNANWISTAGTSAVWVETGPSYTRLFFCYFPPQPGPLPPLLGTSLFPAIGGMNDQYGVLSPAELDVWNQGSGSLYVDDEDEDNQNHYGGAYLANYGVIDRIIYGWNNTTINVVRVR